MDDDRLDRLRRVPLFKGFSAGELRYLASCMDEVEAPEGTHLTREGHSNHQFHVVVDGQVDVEKGGAIVATLGPGDFFGEVSMLGRVPATATVTATKATKVLVMSHAQFRDAIKGNDDLLSAVLGVMAGRMAPTAAAAEDVNSTAQLSG